MARLVAFGSSYTYGDGLPDTFPNNSKPSRCAWPAVLAAELNLECVNMSSQGAGNKKIWHDILNFKFKPDDTVFILWAFSNRYTIFNSKSKFKNLLPWAINDSAEAVAYYHHIYTEYDAELSSKLYINHANNLILSKNITVHHLLLNKESKNLFELGGQTIKVIPLLFEESYKEMYPLSLDNLHPGEECHREFVRDILQWLNIVPTITKQQKLPWFKRICKLI
jgi:hypothetical protein